MDAEAEPELKAKAWANCEVGGKASSKPWKITGASPCRLSHGPAVLEAAKTGRGEGAVIGESSRRWIVRLPAAWYRCGIVLTRNLLGIRKWGL